MAKSYTRYVCSNCGRVSAAYMGRCAQCGEFDTFVEQVVVREDSAGSKNQPVRAFGSKSIALSEIGSDSTRRLNLSIKEFSRVLGGGLVPGSLILVGGDPGIGKSTLLLHVAVDVANRHGRVLYISGEESTNQIKMRASRMELKSDHLFVLTETNLEAMMEQINEIDPVLVIVDSIQTTYSSDKSSSAGSISQVRECASRFQDLCKNTHRCIVLVGHVTKEGTIAGPRVLEHIVDTVLYLEGDTYHQYRLLRGVKNRFGATSEIGVFEMANKGMLEVQNPSEIFLAERHASAPGSAIALTMEGTRSLAVEIQALVSQSTFVNPRRTANGIDYNRLLLVAAVLARRARIRLHDKDIIVNVVGGLIVDEPAADLAVAVAIASSFRDRPVHADMAFVGEIGLSGEIRAVPQIEQRVKEAEKLGFARCLVPRTISLPSNGFPKSLQLVKARALTEALELALIAN